MLKIVSVSDKVGTAIDRLCRGVAKYHTNINYVVLDVHPKRPDPQQLLKFEQEAKTADIIDWQYFRTAETLRGRYDWLKDKRQILTHNNPYSINEQDWNGYHMVVANNLKMFDDLGKITQAQLEYVPLTVDADFWIYNSKWQKSDRVLMVANRIESKKGILQVAIACADAGLKFVLVGNVSDNQYMNDIMSTGNVEFHENVTDEELRQLYYGAALHVCNSVDNFESGTLPILEAMLCGTPVLTRKVGHVPDIYNKTNMAIINSDPDNVPYIKDQIEKLLFDTQKLEDMRRAAWDTAKTRNFERRAYSYQKLYRKLMSPEKPVSIVVPIFDKPEITRKCFDAISNQTYKNIEVIFCNDNPEHEENTNLIKQLAQFVDFPVRYIDEPSEGYGLAKQRNLGIMAATGEIIVFCDQRIIMEPTAVSELVKQLNTNTWVFGDKNGKTNFVENFSAIYRSDIIKAGMFSERINMYGGMSQEIRSRTNKQGIVHKYVPGAKAQQSGKSRNKWTKQSEVIKAKNMLWIMGLD